MVIAPTDVAPEEPADTSPVDATPWVPRAHGREETYQQDLEDYLASRGDMTFSHGVCPTCADQMRLEFSSRR